MGSSNKMLVRPGFRLGSSLVLIMLATLAVTSGDNLALESQVPSARVAQPSSSSCRTVYQQVSIVKQVPSFAKHCTKVDDTKCKTVFKNSISTSMETQCVPTFDTNCDTTLETAYKQECKTINDVECRIVNLDSGSRKICQDVPTQKCESVPVQASNPVPTKQCYKKPRQVCQTLVSAKPKVVTAKIPKQVCEHGSEFTKRKANPSQTKSSKGMQPMRSSNAAGRKARSLMAWKQDGQRESERGRSFGVTTRRHPSVNYGSEQIV